MNLASRLNERLKGARLYLLAALFALPEILNALVGFDWSSVLPAAYAGYGLKIGACLSLARLILPAYLARLRDAARQGKEEGPRQ